MEKKENAVVYQPEVNFMYQALRKDELIDGYKMSEAHVFSKFEDVISWAKEIIAAYDGIYGEDVIVDETSIRDVNVCRAIYINTIHGQVYVCGLKYDLD